MARIATFPVAMVTPLNTITSLGNVMRLLQPVCVRLLTIYYAKLDVDPQRDDDASPMSTYTWDLLECWFQLFSTSRIQFRTFLKKKSNFWFLCCSTREDLSVDVSITNVGLVLTKPGRFLFSAYGNSEYGQNSISPISNFLKKNSHFWVSMVYYSWRPFHSCINY